MKAFMTIGTFDFLKKFVAKNPRINFYFMHGESSTLAYYEDESTTVFVTGTSYEVILTKGNVEETGYVVMNHIPVNEEGVPVFEYKFKERQNDVNSMPGIQAFRLLRPLKGNTYVVFTQWASEKDFETWKESKEFNKSHKAQSVKPPAYQADKPFATSYSMIEEE